MISMETEINCSNNTNSNNNNTNNNQHQHFGLLLKKDSVKIPSHATLSSNEIDLPIIDNCNNNNNSNNNTSDNRNSTSSELKFMDESTSSSSSSICGVIDGPAPSAPPPSSSSGGGTGTAGGGLSESSGDLTLAGNKSSSSTLSSRDHHHPQHCVDSNLLLHNGLPSVESSLYPQSLLNKTNPFFIPSKSNKPVSTRSSNSSGTTTSPTTAITTTAAAATSNPTLSNTSLTDSKQTRLNNNNNNAIIMPSSYKSRIPVPISTETASSAVTQKLTIKSQIGGGGNQVVRNVVSLPMNKVADNDTPNPSTPPVKSTAENGYMNDNTTTNNNNGDNNDNDDDNVCVKVKSKSTHSYPPLPPLSSNRIDSHKTLKGVPSKSISSSHSPHHRQQGQI
ncbi:unnamed protein product [Trichobilharzia szidati]|nr:unnamed protein product [Trichobilharzia szidati]